MTSTDPAQSDSTMGLAIAGRSRRLADGRAGVAVARRAEIDLTTPANVQLPDHILTAAKEALDRGETHYTSRPGVPELRNAIARRLNEEGIPGTGENVIITNGGHEGLYVALQSVVNAGDRVMVVEPITRNIIDMLEFIGAEIVTVTPDRDAGLIPSLDDIASVDAAVLLIGAPSPISGVAPATDHVEQLLKSAIDRGMAVVVDRSASTCYFDDVRERFEDESVVSKIITVGSFSTGHGLLGWRVGYLSAPEERMKSLRNLKQAMSICTTAVSQFAALAALEGPDNWIRERRNALAESRDHAISQLRSAGLDVVVPGVYPPLLIDVSSLGGDDRDVAERLASEAGVVVDPGSDFGSATSRYVRINLAVDQAQLRSGIERIVAYARNGGSNV